MILDVEVVSTAAGWALPVLLLAVLTVLGWFVFTWDREGRWLEASLDGHLLRLRIEHWLRLRWLHPDCRYFILPVFADRGPLVVTGRRPDALYWSLTYYERLEINPIVSSESVEYEDDGSYRITFASRPTDGNWIPLRDGARRVLLYLRVYDPAEGVGTELPSVTQAGATLAPVQVR